MSYQIFLSIYISTRSENPTQQPDAPNSSSLVSSSSTSIFDAFFCAPWAPDETLAMACCVVGATRLNSMISTMSSLELSESSSLPMTFSSPCDSISTSSSKLVCGSSSESVCSLSSTCCSKVLAATVAKRCGRVLMLPVSRLAEAASEVLREQVEVHVEVDE